jgi:hypothetical protein
MKLPVVSAFCLCGWSIACDADDPRQTHDDHQEKQSWMDGPDWEPEGPVTPAILAARIASRLLVEHRKSHKIKINIGGLSENQLCPGRGLQGDLVGEGVG